MLCPRVQEVVHTGRAATAYHGLKHVYGLAREIQRRWWICVHVNGLIITQRWWQDIIIK